jgi:hypothetical protein
MTHGELKGLSQATVGGRWREVGESQELPHRRKWILVEDGQVDSSASLIGL